MKCCGGLLVILWEREREEGVAGFVGRGGGKDGGDTEKATNTYCIELIPRPFKSPFTPFIISFLFFFFFLPE